MTNIDKLFTINAAIFHEKIRIPNCWKYSYDFCPMNYDPVCGTNGITYGNECMMCSAIKESKTKIKIMNLGEC
ncbi:putative serine protease inhibitor Kazal-type 2 [Triplophysa rosa]|uniref:Serine protease inhibitor Kazal-type 2 n=1 Tax=Triplophysa rosa TaxID=992332 RepID=A0A9W7TR40_TRIRA|nr:putative serine protease inhibitor Kazal-type 2 [Triplophysa rosa]